MNFINYDKVAQRITDEIIQELHLYRDYYYKSIHQKICMAIAVGFDIGRSGNYHGNDKAVVQKDIYGHIIRTYPSIKTAANTMDVNSRSIGNAIKSKSKIGGYYWEYLKIDALVKNKRDKHEKVKKNS